MEVDNRSNENKNKKVFTDKFVKWFKAAMIRTLKTFAETAISMLTIGQAFVEVDWANVLSVSGVAALIALGTCIAGLPEVKED